MVGVNPEYTRRGRRVTPKKMKMMTGCFSPSSFIFFYTYNYILIWNPNVKECDGSSVV